MITTTTTTTTSGSIAACISFLSRASSDAVGRWRWRPLPPNVIVLGGGTTAAATATATAPSIAFDARSSQTRLYHNHHNRHQYRQYRYHHRRHHRPYNPYVDISTSDPTIHQRHHHRVLSSTTTRDDDGTSRGHVDANHYEATNSSEEVVVTRGGGGRTSYSPSSSVLHPPPTPLHSDDDDNHAEELVNALLKRTYDMMDPRASNIVAYSGGVDSSLVAALVKRSFDEHRRGGDGGGGGGGVGGSVRAVMGISDAVPRSQLIQARDVAKYIGIELTEIRTNEGDDAEYVKNDGRSCYVCKTHLYSALRAVAMEASSTTTTGVHASESSSSSSSSVILYNGTNADDTLDPTRLGLLAASNYSVRSPLDATTKLEVRIASRRLGLPNWDIAASPCLRSRLAIGVEATSSHLRAVELAEEYVREILDLDRTSNVRVRMMTGGRAVVELDDSFFRNDDDDDDGKGGGGGPRSTSATSLLIDSGFAKRCVDEWGFAGGLAGVRPFRTGSVAVSVPPR
jgi:PP-loop superfamily ATP-utilizing enzyme